MSKDRSQYRDGTKRPIEQPIGGGGYLHGVKNVVSIGDVRVARGRSRSDYAACRHMNLIYCTVERAVWCDDCETRLDPFTAFEVLVERADSIEKRISDLKKIEQETLVSRAAKAFDEVFRRRSVVPLCPHCLHAIFPEDVAKGLPTKSRAHSEEQRRFRK